MKRIIKITITVLIMLLLFQIGSFAKENSSSIEEYSEIFNEIDSQTQVLLEELGLEDFKTEDLLNLSPRKLIDLIISLIKGGWHEPIRAVGTVLAIAMLGAMLNALNISSAKNENLFSFFESAIIAITFLSPLSTALTAAVSAIKLLSDFMLLYIPIFAGVISASGFTVSSFSYSGIMLGFSEICSKLSFSLIVPSIFVLTVFSIFSSLNSNIDFSEIVSVIKKTVTVFLSLIAGIFTGLIALKSKIAVATDNVAIKGVKLLSGSVIPIVGGAVGDAFSSVLGSFALIRNTVGAFGIIAIILTVAPSVINLLMWYFSLNICSAFCSLAGNNTTAKTLKSVNICISLINTLLIFFSTVFIVTTGIMIDLKG